jgi:hypothetical protein
MTSISGYYFLYIFLIKNVVTITLEQSREIAHIFSYELSRFSGKQYVIFEIIYVSSW